MRILHLEDDPSDALLVQRTLTRHGIEADIRRAQSAEEFGAALAKGGFDAIVLDGGIPGFSGMAALRLARERHPEVPVIICSGAAQEAEVAQSLAAGATDYVLKDHVWQLVNALRRVASVHRASAPAASDPSQHAQAMTRLVRAVQELSLARSLESVIAIVRGVARQLTGADGATFVLRDGDRCHYVDEDAIAPLWKGQRFPMSACISGWTMLHRESAVIEDIYADPRIPADAYRPTFVKSLVMVPIRTAAPIGAIGNYWATRRQPSAQEVELLETLANTTSVAMENVQVYAELEQRVKARTRELEAANRELESFSYAVSHDLRAPLRAVRCELDHLLDARQEKLEPVVHTSLESARAQARRMGALIEDLLRLAKIGREALQREPTDLSALVTDSAARLRAQYPGREVQISIEPGLRASVDPGLLSVVVENLLSNAWKYTARRTKAHITFGALHEDDESVFFVRDDGVGFDMRTADRLFSPFQRLHSGQEFTGTGVGLATVQRIVDRHGGRLWAESAPGQGATFFFTLPA